MTNEALEKRVNHPSWYTQHPSGIECIELIEHLPCNLANAVKYIWRCSLKQSETPLRDLKSALWYTNRESERITLFELDGLPQKKTDIMWRALAKRVIWADRDSLLGWYLAALLDEDFAAMKHVIEAKIDDLDKKTT